MDPFIGQVMMFGGNFAPRAWAFCEGQLLAISSHSALFSILGTIYGGDGRTTFALPDLRGRTALQQGNGPGLPSYRLGQSGGSEKNTISTSQMPSHNHTVTMPIGTAPADETEAGFLGAGTFYVEASNADYPITESPAGGGQSVNNIQPYLAINYIIALQGVYPSRN